MPQGMLAVEIGTEGFCEMDQGCHQLFRPFGSADVRAWKMEPLTQEPAQQQRSHTLSLQGLRHVAICQQVACCNAGVADVLLCPQRAIYVQHTAQYLLCWLLLSLKSQGLIVVNKPNMSVSRGVSKLHRLPTAGVNWNTACYKNPQDQEGMQEGCWKPGRRTR